MNKPVLNNSTVEKYRTDLEVIRETAAQIIKDFELSGIEITFSGNEFTAYREMTEQITQVLANLYENKNTVFRSLLYRIDVNENKVNEILNSPHAHQQAEQIAALVIEREFVKVLFRKFYS